MSQRPHPDPGERPVPSKAAPESAMAAGEGEDAFLEAASRANSRMAEAASAIVALNADNVVFRDEVEARLSERFERLRDRVLLSSKEAVAALDRALEATLAQAGAAPLFADAVRVRTQLSGLLRDEQHAKAPARRPGVATL